MNKIADNKEKELMHYLCNDLVDSPDTSAARCKQQKGLRVFKNTISLQTSHSMHDNEFQQIYNNSFSRCRSRFDEYSKVSLTSKERK